MNFPSCAIMPWNTTSQRQTISVPPHDLSRFSAAIRTENTTPTPETRSCGVATNGCQQQPWDIASLKNTASEMPLFSNR